MKPIRKIIWIALISLILIMLYFINPIECSFAPKCPFKYFTGFSCPGCGVQRATHAFLHGHVLEAIHYNLFLIISIPYLFSLFFANTVLKDKQKERAIAVLEGKTMVYGYVIFFIIWFIIRNIYHI